MWMSFKLRACGCDTWFVSRCALHNHCLLYSCHILPQGAVIHPVLSQILFVSIRINICLGRHNASGMYTWTYWEQMPSDRPLEIFLWLSHTKWQAIVVTSLCQNKFKFRVTNDSVCCVCHIILIFISRILTFGTNFRLQKKRPCTVPLWVFVWVR